MTKNSNQGGPALNQLRLETNYELTICMIPKSRQKANLVPEGKMSLTFQFCCLLATTVTGVPAKMRTRENVHLTILRQRILIRRQNSPVSL